MGDKPIFDLGPTVDGGPSVDVGSGGGSEGQDIGLDKQTAADRKSRDLQAVRVRRQAESAKRTGLLLTLALIVVAIGALIAVALLTTGDAEEQATPVEDRSVGDEAVGGGGAGADQDLTAPVLAFEPPSREHLRADEVASLFQRQIDTDASRYGIAYVAADDFVVLDHRGITLPELEIAVDFDTVSNLALLTTNGRTWAVDPQHRDRNYLVSNSYVVVVSERADTIAIIRPDDRSRIGLMSSALPVPPVALPEGSALLWAQGRGPLVMPRTGGTFAVSGLASSLTRISDDRAVAASLRGTIYETCDDELQCTYFSQLDDGEVRPLPFDAGTDFSISPDGSWLVASTENLVVVYDLTEGAEVATLERQVTSLDWSPDSAFVAIVDGDLLLILYPDSGEITPIRLNHTPDDGSLLVFDD